MSLIIFFLSFFWFLILTKKLFFWLWLWQLKDYHLWRFREHFETEKGKKLILNWLNFIKLGVIFGLFLFFPIFIFPLFFLFFSEAGLTLWHLFKRTFRTPVQTFKTKVILASGFGLEVFLFLLLKSRFSGKEFYLGLVLVDFLAPIIFSLLILAFQPLTVILRNRVLAKARKKREEFKNLTVVAITGSYGKTSTKEFLATILSGKQKVLKTEKHQNSEIGISQCILEKLKPEHEIFICEMGAYRQGGIKLLCDITKPKIGILTGINEQHLGTFGSLEKIIETKFELIKSLPENGIAILNYDNELIKERVESIKYKVSGIKYQAYKVSEKKLCSAKKLIKDLVVEKTFLSFKMVSEKGESINFRVNLAGKQNIENLVLAISCAKELGMSLEEITRACQKIRPLEKTMELKEGRGGVLIIDSSYSANPEGVMAALEHLKLFSGRKIIVMPCLIELGKASKEIHQKIGEKIGEAVDLAIITTKDRFQEIRMGAIKTGLKEENILFLDSPEKIFEKLKPDCVAPNVILLQSRVPEKLINLLLLNK